MSGSGSVSESVSESGSGVSSVGLDVSPSLRSTPQSVSLGRVLAGLPLSSPLPKEPSAFWSRFGFSAPPPFLQRSVLRPVEKSLFSDLKDRLSSSPVSSSSFSACLAPSSRAWLLALPSSSLSLSDREFSLVSRLRLGLPPSDTLPSICRCSGRMLDDPGHFLSCPLLRPLARVRHDRLVRRLATLIQRRSLVILRTSVPISTPFSPMPVLCLMSVRRTLLLRLAFVSLLVLRLSIARTVRFPLMS